MELTTLSSRGQIVLPEKVRKRLGLSAGDRFVLLRVGEDIILRRAEIAEKQLLENEAWRKLGEKALVKLWDNDVDNEVWG